MAKDNKNLKEISCTLEEIFTLEATLNEFRGNLSTLSVILEDIRGIGLTQSEKAKIEFATEEKPEGVFFRWNPEKGKLFVKKVTLQEDTVDFIRTFIKNKSDNGELSVKDRELINIKEKLG